MALRTHTFRGTKYHLILDSHIEGYAMVPSERDKFEIYVDPDLPDGKWLETAVHEAMHAEDPETPEAVIDRRAKSMARWLWRLGFRRKGD